MDDEALLDIMRSSPRASERRAAACELLVSRHQGLVWSCVRGYRNGSEPTEDLMQVGYVGLLKAIGNFDPVFCRSLAAYARPCISGELKRYFRDRRWQAHVNRPVQELALQIREATWRLAQELGRTPTDSDLTRHLGVSGDDLRHAQQAEVTFQSYSLDAPLPGQQDTSILADSLGAEDPRQEHMLSMQAVAAHWGELPLREQEILLMRFGSGMTQTQIGQRLGISQMQVSRLTARALGYLRSHLLDLEGTHPGPRLAHRGGRADPQSLLISEPPSLSNKGTPGSGRGRILRVECVVRARELAAGPGPRLAAEAGRRSMSGVELSTREWG